MKSWTTVLAIIFCATAATAQNNNTIYSSIPKPLPGNVSSEGPEAYAFIELGDGIVFTPGSGGTFQTVTLIMSDWACQHGHWYVPIGSVALNGDGPCVTKPGAGKDFSQTITLNIYAVVGTPPAVTPGLLLASITQPFDIPFRPSSDAAHCGPGGTPGGDGMQWYSDRDKTCYHGLAIPIAFDLTKLAVPVPADNRAIVTLEYNTSDYGPHPLRPEACNSLPPPDNDNCPYDSLNISTDSGYPANTVFVGSFLVPDSIFVNYASDATACPGNNSTGVLAIDEGCWTGFHPEIEVVSTPRATPLKGKGPLNP